MAMTRFYRVRVQAHGSYRLSSAPPPLLASPVHTVELQCYLTSPYFFTLGRHVIFILYPHGLNSGVHNLGG